MSSANDSSGTKSDASASAPASTTTSSPTTNQHPNEMPRHWKIGQTRVVDSAGYIGTLAYVGPVASSAAASSSKIYAGVIWDNVSRGKHNGSVVSTETGNLVQHFVAGHATAASFVPIRKVHTGVTLTPFAVLQKYVDTNSKELVAPDTLLPHSVLTARGHSKPVYFVGELQIRSKQQVQDLTVVSLRNMRLSGFDAADWNNLNTTNDADDAGSAANNDATANVDSIMRFDNWRVMDLAGNLFSDWSVVAVLLQTFTQLTSLSLAQNRLGNLPTSTSGFQLLPTNKLNLLKLNLHGTRLSETSSLVQIGQSAPALLELCVADCSFTDMMQTTTTDCHQDALAQAFPALELLDCSNCGLTSGQVRAWAGLPRLQRLSLDDNPLECIQLVAAANGSSVSDNNNNNGAATFTTRTADGSSVDKETITAVAASPSCDFVSLQHLQIAGTRIKSWADLEGLNAVPSITGLRLRKCPLLEPLGTGQARSLLIARLPALEYLNASFVTDAERVEAEKRYVMQVHRQVLAATVALDSDGQRDEKRLEILSQHPQWERLTAKHKEAMIHSLGLAHGENAGGTHLQSLADTVLNVTICSMAANSCTMDPLIRRLPSGLEIGRLKALCARHFGLDIDLQTLHYRTSTDAFPVAMDDDENTLAYYGVSNGAEILMNERDVRQQKKEEQELVDRMKRQELELNAFQERQKRQGAVTIASVADTGKSKS